MKTPEDDFFLGRTVLENKTVSREALLETLFQMAQERKAGNPRPLGVLLVTHGHLTQEDLEECVRLQEEIRASGKTAPALGELVVHRGYVTEGQVHRVLAYQRKAVF